MQFNIITVKEQTDVLRFVKSQWNFYKGDKYFVPPIIADRLKLLNTEKNPFYKHAELQLFLAVSGDEVIGRIAAITNENHNITHNDKVGFFGFFECIDNQEVANALFKKTAEWLVAHGKNVMRGPVNPSFNDEIGLLVDGFDGPPRIMMLYNPPYYIDLIEKAGFAKAHDLYAYLLKNKDYASDKMKRLQNVIRERNKLIIRKVNFKNKKQFYLDVKAIKEIYNAAWQPNWGFVKATDEEFDFLAADLKQVAEPELTLLAYINDQPVGFALALPDINQCLIYNKSGSLLGAIWHMLTKKKKIDICRIITLGVIPDYQKTGIDSVLYWEVGERAHKIGIDMGEASWILDDNTMMNRGLQTTMHGTIYKTYRIYDKNL